METKKTRIRGNKRAKYVFRLPDDDIATQMAIGQGDLDIIEVYKAILGVSRNNSMVQLYSSCTGFIVALTCNKPMVFSRDFMVAMKARVYVRSNPAVPL